MTLFDFNIYSEIKEPGWNMNTLRPPLKFREIILDFRIQWTSYHESRLPVLKRLKFLILRIFQRISYNFGWIISMKNCRKSESNKGEN